MSTPSNLPDPSWLKAICVILEQHPFAALVMMLFGVLLVMSIYLMRRK